MLWISIILFTIWLVLPCYAQSGNLSMNTVPSNTKHWSGKVRERTTRSSHFFSTDSTTAATAATDTTSTTVSLASTGSASISSSSTTAIIEMAAETSSALSSTVTLPTTSSVPVREPDGNGNGTSLKHSDREVPVIVLFSFIGGMILVLVGLFIWYCVARRAKRAYALRSPSPDEREFESWRRSAHSEPTIPDIEVQTMPDTPSMSRSSYSTERYYSVSRPAPSLQVEPLHFSPPSTSGILLDTNPFDDTKYEYGDLSIHRHLTDNPPTPAQLRIENKRSTQSLQARPPTPLFGCGQTPGETSNEHPMPRKNSTRPRPSIKSPLNNSPIAGSPATSEFDFGFKPKPATIRHIEQISSGTVVSLDETKALTPQNF